MIAANNIFQNKNDGRLAYMDTSHGFYNVHTGQKSIFLRSEIENSKEWHRMTGFDMFVMRHKEIYPFVNRVIDNNPDTFDHQVRLRCADTMAALNSFINRMQP